MLAAGGSLAATMRLAFFALAFAGGCATGEGGAYTDHDEDADFEPFDGTKADGVTESFIANNILDDALFNASHGFLGADAVQAFLEVTPYNGKRSFLADANLGSQTAAQAIVAAGEKHGVNPLLLLV